MNEYYLVPVINTSSIVDGTYITTDTCKNLLVLYNNGYEFTTSDQICTDRYPRVSIENISHSCGRGILAFTFDLLNQYKAWGGIDAFLAYVGETIMFYYNGLYTEKYGSIFFSYFPSLLDCGNNHLIPHIFENDYNEFEYVKPKINVVSMEFNKFLRRLV